jgi:hypothetical protein
MLYYGFSHQTDRNVIHCREGYQDAEALINHLKNVQEPLNEMFKIADLERIECHGPVAEIAKLRTHLKPLGCEFYESDNKGIRR